MLTKCQQKLLLNVTRSKGKLPANLHLDERAQTWPHEFVAEDLRREAAVAGTAGEGTHQPQRAVLLVRIATVRFGVRHLVVFNGQFKHQGAGNAIRRRHCDATQ